MVQLCSNSKFFHVLVAVIGKSALLQENKLIALHERVWLSHKPRKKLTNFVSFTSLMKYLKIKRTSRRKYLQFFVNPGCLNFFVFRLSL